MPNRVTRVAEVHPEGARSAFSRSRMRSRRLDRISSAAIPALPEAAYKHDTSATHRGHARARTRSRRRPRTGSSVRVLPPRCATGTRCAPPSIQRQSHGVRVLPEDGCFPRGKRAGRRPEGRVRAGFASCSARRPRPRDHFSTTTRKRCRASARVKDPRLNETLYVMNGNGSRWTASRSAARRGWSGPPTTSSSSRRRMRWGA